MVCTGCDKEMLLAPQCEVTYVLCVYIVVSAEDFSVLSLGLQAGSNPSLARSSELGLLRLLPFYARLDARSKKFQSLYLNHFEHCVRIMSCPFLV